MKLCYFLFSLSLSFSAMASLSSSAARCTDDIVLVNDSGCSSACCFQDPPNSGNYVFLHRSVESIDIRGNSANVVSLSFPNLVSVEKSIRIAYNQPGAIGSISFPALQSAGSIAIQSNPGLLQVNLSRLMNIQNNEQDAFLKVQSNPALMAFDASLLQQVTAFENGSAYVEFRYNHALDVIELPKLRTVEALDSYGEAYLFISQNDQVQAVNMNALFGFYAGEESISWLVVDDMPAMNQISFPKLTEMMPTGSEYNFSEVTVGHSPNLTEFVFPSLERVTVLQLSNLKGTRKAMFPSLSELDYLWVFRSCESAETTMKMYICSEKPLVDMYLDNGDGLCGSNGYMLYSANPVNRAECDASENCESFIPAVDECRCGNIGSCTTSL